MKEKISVGLTAEEAMERVSAVYQALGESLYLVGMDTTSCKCGKGDRAAVSYFVKTTRYVEKDLGHCSYAWVCEKCECTWQFDYPLREDTDFHYCPKCGRRITEFVKYKDDYVEGE